MPWYKIEYIVKTDNLEQEYNRVYSLQEPAEELYPVDVRENIESIKVWDTKE